MIEPRVRNVAADRTATAGTKAARQLPHRQLAQLRELGQRRRIANFVQTFVNEPQAPRRQAAAALDLVDSFAIAGEFDAALRAPQTDQISDERRVGTDGGSPGRITGAPYH